MAREGKAISRGGSFPKLSAAPTRSSTGYWQLHMFRLHLARLLTCRRSSRDDKAILNARQNVNYCASKAYITQFSKGLDVEVRPHGVHVQALCPGFTTTEFHDTPEMSGFDRSDFPQVLWMSAEEVVAISLEALGSEKVVVIPGRRNQMIVRSSQWGIGHTVRAVGRKLLRRR